MGGPVCFSEIGLRYMPAWTEPPHQHWHRDCAFLEGHPLRLNYLQMMVYLGACMCVCMCVCVWMGVCMYVYAFVKLAWGCAIGLQLSVVA